MFSQFKVWIYGVGAALVAIAVAMFKYRGNKIEKLEEDLETAEHNVEVVDKVIENERKVNTYEMQNKVAAAKAEVVEEVVLTEPLKDYEEVHDEDPVKRFFNI